MAERLTNEDTQILHALHEIGSSSTKQIALHLGQIGHTAAAGWRLRAMLKKGLTKRVARDQYEITEAGRQALRTSDGGKDA